MIDTKELGQATKKLLETHGLPSEILHHGTVVQFALKDGTHVPVEEQIISKIQQFLHAETHCSRSEYRGRNRKTRSDGKHSDVLRYDFPLGVVLGRFDDSLDLGELGKLPVTFSLLDLTCRWKPTQNIQRRENGLLFVDDNDAVLDLTLLPPDDRSPYLKHIFGVRISGFRAVLETKLEAEDAARRFSRPHEMDSTSGARSQRSCLHSLNAMSNLFMRKKRSFRRKGIQHGPKNWTSE